MEICQLFCGLRFKGLTDLVKIGFSLQWQQNMQPNTAAEVPVNMLHM